MGEKPYGKKPCRRQARQCFGGLKWFIKNMHFTVVFIYKDCQLLLFIDYSDMYIFHFHKIARNTTIMNIPSPLWIYKSLQIHINLMCMFTFNCPVMLQERSIFFLSLQMVSMKFARYLDFKFIKRHNRLSGIKWLKLGINLHKLSRSALYTGQESKK